MFTVNDRSLPSRRLTNGRSVGVLEGLFTGYPTPGMGPYVSPDLEQSGGFGALGLPGMQGFGDAAPPPAVMAGLLNTFTQLDRRYVRAGERLKELAAKIGTTDPQYQDAKAAFDEIHTARSRAWQAIYRAGAEPVDAAPKVSAFEAVLESAMPRIDAGFGFVAKLANRVLDTTDKAVHEAGSIGRWVAIGALVLGGGLLISGKLPLPAFLKQRAARARRCGRARRGCARRSR